VVPRPRSVTNHRRYVAWISSAAAALPLAILSARALTTSSTAPPVPRFARADAAAVVPLAEPTRTAASVVVAPVEHHARISRLVKRRPAAPVRHRNQRNASLLQKELFRILFK